MTDETPELEHPKPDPEDAAPESTEDGALLPGRLIMFQIFFTELEEKLRGSSEPMPSPTLLQRLKERKLVQWALSVALDLSVSNYPRSRQLCAAQHSWP